MFFSFFRSRGGSGNGIVILSKQTDGDGGRRRELTLESLDDEGAGGGDEGDLGLSVLDRQLNSNP
jgi:hypothetical protein